MKFEIMRLDCICYFFMCNNTVDTTGKKSNITLCKQFHAFVARYLSNEVVCNDRM